MATTFPARLGSARWHNNETNDIYTQHLYSGPDDDEIRETDPMRRKREAGQAVYKQGWDLATRLHARLHSPWIRVVSALRGHDQESS
jgi:hypothetical protein